MPTAAYNFVPLSGTILRPEWQDRVSHDCPLAEGLSAQIDITIHNDTPLLVGGQPRNPVDFFKHPDGTPAIPGASLRGMLRNVLEIATFSRLSLMDDKQLAIRDVRPGSDYLRQMVTSSAQKGGVPRAEPAALAGWLRFENGGWTIHPCEHGRICHSVLSARFGVDIKSPYSPNKPDCASIQWKYELVRKHLNDLRLYAEASDWKIDWHRRGGQEIKPITGKNGTTQNRYRPVIELRYRDVKDVHRAADSARRIETRLVVTGQPSAPSGKARDGYFRSGKHMEFLFRVDTARALPVSPKVFRGFRDTHPADDKRTGAPSSWEFYRHEKPFGKLGVPVFYRTDSQSGEVSSFGLAQLYRLPYPKTLRGYTGVHAQPVREGERRLDFVETLFGCLPLGESDEGLKSRVSIGDCRLQGPLPAKLAHASFLRETVLSSPKPSYFPFYVEQSAVGNHGLKTLLDEAASLRGWKRYPVRMPEAVNGVPEAPDEANPEMRTQLRPLAAVATFGGRIRLHNVMPQELGAVLWALTWGGRSFLRHALGMGKAFGLGQVHISVAGLQVQPHLPSPASAERTCQDYVALFESWAQEAMTGSARESATPSDPDPVWRQSPQLQELFKMADPRMITGDLLKSPRFSTDPRSNEFQQIKLSRPPVWLPRWGERVDEALGPPSSAR